MPKNTSGLKPFPPGTSGNPGGRPKKRPITDEYFDLADKPIPEKLRAKLQKKYCVDLPQGITFSQMNALARYLDAMEPDGQTSSKEIREAMEGKAPMRLEISGPQRQEITIRLVDDRTKK